jgi:quinol monooxygenase YgiN
LSVTVLCELRPHPDQADAVIQRSIEQLSLPAHEGRIVRLLQHVDDPAWLLYLAEWDSREAFEAYRRSAPLLGTVDQLQQPVVSRFYRRLALFERVMSAGPVISADLVDGPAQTHAARRDLALAYHRSGVRGRSGLVLLHVHEALDPPPGLLVISGWEGMTQLQQADQAAERTMLDQLVANGGAVRRFVGRALIETASL